jgi:glycosyltransferase involved in cell wall biosynthesis
MKILSFQYFSLYFNGGGSRILRRLYEGREDQVTSLVVSDGREKIQSGKIKEIIVYASPIARPWMRWYLRRFSFWLREKALLPLTINRIRKAALTIQYDVIHIVQHGPFSTALCSDKFCAGKALWVSFHDHFSTTDTSFTDTKTLWDLADRRLVISNELGNEYQKQFGQKAFEVITDGVNINDLNKPSAEKQSPVIVYFGGLLHIGYLQLFEVLASALDLLTVQGYSFRLILRGTPTVAFLSKRSFEVVYMPLSFNNAELNAELNSAAILYLPIKFTHADFYLYSLSTKMVGYLGAAGATLYHGPADSAACNLLKAANAALCCSSLDAVEMAAAIVGLLNNKLEISGNAKVLAHQQFNLVEIQGRFWQVQ